MSKFFRTALGADFGYVPGEQPADSEEWLKLNSNKSPLPPSPKVSAAVAGAARDLARYPSPVAEPLRSALARLHGLAPEQVFVGNGADQVLDCCYRAYASPGDTVVRTEPGYSLLPVLAALFSARDVAVPVAPDGSLPDDFAQVRAVLRIVVNPNSPTGHWIEPDALETRLAAATGIVVIDEAYCDFAPASCISLLAANPSWVIVRTLSKSYALAGLQVGYALAARDVIADLNAVRDSYPVDRCAVAGAMAAVDDDEHHSLIVGTIVRERERLSDGLTALGWTVGTSHANFVFATPPVGVTVADAMRRFRDARILVRTFSLPGLDHGLRISVGDGPATDRVLHAITQLSGA